MECWLLGAQAELLAVGLPEHIDCWGGGEVPQSGLGPASVGDCCFPMTGLCEHPREGRLGLQGVHLEAEERWDLGFQGVGVVVVGDGQHTRQCLS